MIYKKSLKKCLRFFHKTFSNCQGTYKKEFYLLFEKSGDFSQSEHRDRFDSSPSSVYFYSLFKDPHSPSTTNPSLKRVHLNIYIKNDGNKLVFKPSQVIYICQTAKFLNLMVYSANKKTRKLFLGSNEKKNTGKEQGQD